jgi:hypothetical protein
MRHLAVLTAAVCGLVASMVGTAGAAGCANEALRLGPSAGLSECRAYEMVSPVDKDGGNVGRVLGVKVAPAGDAATFYSPAAFAGSPSAALSTGYIAKRSASGWATEALDPPQRGTGNSLLMSTVASTFDLRASLSAGDRAIAPGAVEAGSNLYLRDNATGTPSLAFSAPGTRLFDQATGLSGGLYLGGTADWSHIIIRSNSPLTADSPSPETFYYDYLYDLSGGRLHLLNYLPDGSVETNGPTKTIDGYRPYSFPISADGRRVFLQLGVGGDSGVFMREDDERTVPLSVEEETGETRPAVLEFANRQGTQAYFTSSAALTPGAPSGSLYRYDVGSGSLVNLTPTAEAGEAGLGVMLGASPDGSDAYFLATGALGDGATAAGFLESNLYARHDGEVRFLGRTENYLPAWQTSPDGRYLAFASFADPTGGKATSPNCPDLTPEYQNGAGNCMDVYVYDSVTDQLSCATCSGGPDRSHAMLGGQQAREPSIQQGTEFARAMIDDGTVFFETASKLVPHDLNGVMDAYSWRAGTPDLVSTGIDPAPSWFSTASPDGRDVLFLTNEALVGADIDRSVDLYDARAGGGLASQWPPGSPPPCVGEGCKSASPAPAARLLGGSSATTGEPGCEAISLRAAAPRDQAKRLGKQAKVAARRRSHASGERARKLGAQVKKLRGRAADKRRAAKRIQNQAKSCRGTH